MEADMTIEDVDVERMVAAVKGSDLCTEKRIIAAFGHSQISGMGCATRELDEKAFNHFEGKTFSECLNMMVMTGYIDGGYFESSHIRYLARFFPKYIKREYAT